MEKFILQPWHIAGFVMSFLLGVNLTATFFSVLVKRLKKQLEDERKNKKAN